MSRSTGSQRAFLAMATLVTGTMFSGCQTRLKEDVVAGVEIFVTQVLLDPTTITCNVFGDSAPAELCNPE